VTLVAFNENVFTLSRRDATRESRQRALDRLAPWGGTALYDVLLKGMEMLRPTTGRRALVVFSDGYDQSSRTSLEAATRAVEGGDAALYVIVLGQTAEARQSRKIVDELSRQSGGRAFFRNKVEDLDADFGRITEELFNQYLLAYSSTNATRDETWRRIKVEVADSRYRVRARQGYRAIARNQDR
jgi:VWFA-related protein